MTRRYFTALPALALLLTPLLTACGDDDARTDADSQATDSIATYLSDGHGLLDRDDALCVASALIEEKSAEELQELGFLKDNLTVNDQPNPEVAPAFTDAWLSCSTLGVFLVRGSGTGVADCVDEAVQEPAARNYMLQLLGADEVDTERSRVTGDLIEMCRVGDQ